MKRDKEWFKKQHQEVWSNFYNNLEGMSKLRDRIEELIEQLDEPEKLVVPQFVDDFIKSKEKENLDKWKMASSFISHIKYKKGSAYEWSQQKGNMDKFLSALVNDYEVEKEPLYYVKLPNTNSLSEYLYLAEGKTSKDHWFNNRLERIEYESNTCKHQFTEREIKDYDTRYWAFVVPVEEEE